MSGPFSFQGRLPDLRSELCKSCLHTKVCCHDKNLFGDFFVPPHPLLGKTEEAWQRFKEREAAGFPCEDYLPDPEAQKNES